MWSLLVSCFAFLPLATTLLVPSDNAISRRQGHIPASRNYLAVYVQTLHTPNDKPLSLHPILTEFTGVTHVIIAGLHLNSPTNITLNGYAPSHANYAQLWSDVEKLQYRGVKVMAMVGGASEGDWTGLAGNNATFRSYYRALRDDFIKAHNLDGLDLNVEERVEITTPLRLLKSLYEDMGSDFILTMSPLASALIDVGRPYSGFSYRELDGLAVAPDGNKLVSWYNAQFFGGYTSLDNSTDYKKIMDQGWEPSRILLGVYSNSNSGKGFWTIPRLQETIRQIKQEYADFRGANVWEYWNAGLSEGYANPWEWLRALAVPVHT